MTVDMTWHRTLDLHDGRRQNLIYSCPELDEITSEPGLYIFGRRFGESKIPIYIGQATNLRRRVEQQLNNVRLMMGIRNMESGRRLLMLGSLGLRQGQQVERVLDLVETAYVKSALSAGFELLNIHGTRTPVHSIRSNGRKLYHMPFPRRMNTERR